MLTKLTESITVPTSQEVEPFKHAITVTTELSDITVTGSTVDVIQRTITDAPFRTRSLGITTG